MKHLTFLMALISYNAFGQLSDYLDKIELGPNFLVVLKEPYNLTERLDSIMAQISTSNNYYDGAGETPQSIYEAAEFVEHSTHMKTGISQCIEYQGFHILSDVIPFDCKEWLVIGEPDVLNNSSIFRSGYVIKKGQKAIYPYRLPEMK